ncbi:MAG: hypothetical protein JW881_02895 [Spirochaetales bacterium]|nr:hypothetical protein [Spirochaetales bacterium]
MRKIMIKAGIVILLILQGFTLHAQSPGGKGDVNSDGDINIIDALLVAQYYVGIDVTFAFPERADVNGNGVVDIVDALLIARYYVGLISAFPSSGGGIEIVGSGLERETAPDPEPGELEAVVAGNNAFAFDCYGQVSEGDGNVFFSPVSISFAFGMCYAGANGNTKTEMARVMHYALPENNLHNAFNALDLALASGSEEDPDAGEPLKLFIANSTWGQKDYYFVPAYLDVLAKYYGADMFTVDFKTAPEECRILINDWVSDKTEERIEDLLPPGSITDLARLVLTNAIYFKATWLDKFDEAQTRDESFYPADGSAVTVPLMHQSVTTSYCEVSGSYQAIKLGYQGKKKNSMIVILPAEGQFGKFEEKLSQDVLDEIIGSMGRFQVTLTIPKFSFEWEQSLKGTLRSLGMSDAFDDMEADFSGINGENDLFIHDVFHKTFVSVDEEGTEAAAATAIIIGITSMPPSAVMRIDRPFIFLIYNDDTGAILFFGRVMQP